MAITDADLLPEVDVEALIGELYVPFPQDQIKIRNDAGTGNKDLSYVPHPEYTRRLDKLFPMSWDFKTELAGLTDTAVAVKGSLSITLEDGRTITRENYGNGNINRMFPIGDGMKSAASDALKKCCSMFGIGLSLYDDDEVHANASANNDQHRGNGQYHDQPPDFGTEYHDYEQDFNGPPRRQSDARFEQGNDPAPATNKQIIALQNIAKNRKTDPALAKEIKQKLETPTADDSPRVSKKEASDLISRAFDKD